MKKAVVNLATGRTEHVDMNAREIAQREAEQAAWDAGATQREALAEIARLESLVTPRRMAEAVLNEPLAEAERGEYPDAATGSQWLSANRAAIAAQRALL